MKTILYRDWTDEEIKTAGAMRHEYSTYKKISDTLNRPYGQVRSLIALLEKMERLKAAGFTPLDYRIPDELMILASKLEKIKSPYSDICNRAAAYIKEMHREIRQQDELRKVGKSVWNTV